MFLLGIKRCYYICSNPVPLSWYEAKEKCKNHRSGPMELGQDDRKEAHELISSLILDEINTRSKEQGIQKRSLKVEDEAWLGGIYMKRYGWCWIYKGNIIIIRYIFFNNHLYPMNNSV